MPRGGKREGAGGKPLDEVARVPVSATLSAELVALLDAAAGVSGRSRSMLVNEAVEAHTDALQAMVKAHVADLRDLGATPPAEAVEPLTGRRGARPGAGRPPLSVALEVTLPAHVAARLQEAEARTRRSRSALIAGALTVGGYWLEVVGLPPLEAAPPYLAEVWLEVSQKGSAVVLAAPGEPRVVRSRPIPTNVSGRFYGYRSTVPDTPPVCIVRDYTCGTWVVGEGDDGFPMGFYIGPAELEPGPVDLT